ncbi:MAG: peptide chain release factor N(5)-glutamine methyltransferase [Desulfovibrio sp.]|nr:peptide chain release factor N(5)-glutamine methyltransferase [Desulfovibrio sp.]
MHRPRHAASPPADTGSDCRPFHIETERFPTDVKPSAAEAARFRTDTDLLPADAECFPTETGHFHADAECFLPDTGRFPADAERFLTDTGRFPADAPRFLAAATHFLDKARADSPRLTAEVLLAAACGVDRADLLKELIMSPGQPLDPAHAAKARAFIGRRAAGEPTAYITGKKEFYGRTFTVGPEVLIPRPESELLIELASAASPSCRHGTDKAVFADFGTGSGCLAAILDLELPDNWRGLALDMSEGALHLASQNCRALGCSRVAFFRADFNHPPLRERSLNLLVANPPYVSAEEYARLPREIREHEPKTALVPVPARGAEGNVDGSSAALSIVRCAETLLKPGGLLLLEIGEKQGARLLSALRAGLWREARLHTDHAGRDRALVARLRHRSGLRNID